MLPKPSNTYQTGSGKRSSEERAPCDKGQPNKVCEVLPDTENKYVKETGKTLQKSGRLATRVKQMPYMRFFQRLGNKYDIETDETLRKSRKPK